MPLTFSLATTPASNAPTLVSPIDGVIEDTTLGVTASWTYNPAQVGETQTGWLFERQILGQGVWQWWDNTNQVWSTIPVLNNGAATSVTFPPGAWPTGQTYAWSVSTLDAGGYSPYASAFSVVAIRQGTCEITAPIGQISVMDPTMTWLTDYPVGYEQAAYRIVIEHGTTAAATAPGTGTTLWDSNTVESQAQSAPIGMELTPTEQVTFWLQLTGTDGLLTPWATSQVTPTAAGFAQPTITATPGVDAQTSMPMVTVVVNFDTSLLPTPSGQERLVRVLLSYSDDQQTWYTVRDRDGDSAVGARNPWWFSEQAIGSATFTDYESTPGVERYYHATVSVYFVTPGVGGGSVPAPNPYFSVGGGAVPSPIPTGSITQSTINVEAVTTAGYWVLKHPSSPSLSCILHLDRETDLQAIRTDRQQVVWPISAEAPVVLDDALGLPAITVPAIFLTQAEYNAFITLRQTKDVFLLQGPSPAGQWYVRLGDTTNDSTNLKSIRQTGGSGKVVRNVTFTAQAVAASTSGYVIPGTNAST